MRQPPGFEVEGGKVCKLNKSLYGLKQSGKNFHDKLKSLLMKQYVVQSKADPCVFARITEKDKLYLGVCLDDILLMASSKEVIEKSMNELKKDLELSYAPLSYFLGIQLHRTADGGMCMFQQRYALEVIERFGMSECKSVATPMDNAIYADETEDNPKREYPYRQIIGALQYLSICTRPDISHATNLLARFLDKYQRRHWLAALRILRYLKGTSDYGIHFGGKNTDLSFQAFCDANFANCPDTRRSTSGEIFKRYGGAILWSSTRQPITTLSSCESELVSACNACKSALWLKQLLNELGHKVTPVLQIDNLATIHLIKNGAFSRRTKHISLRYHFISEIVEAEDVKITHVSTQLQAADILTKNLTKTPFQKIRALCGIQSCSK